MAIGTYAELQTSLAAWLDGTDFLGREADFIALTEDEINARLAAAINEGAVIRPMMQMDPLTIDAEYVDLPDGNTVLPISIEVSGLDRPWKIEYQSLDNMIRFGYGVEGERASVSAAIGANPPRYYTLVGDQLRFFPAPEASFSATIGRFVEIPALSDATPTNWVLASHRNVYLYGCLAQAELFGWNAKAGAETWATLFDGACGGLIARYPVQSDMTPLRSELTGFRPGGYSYSSFMGGL